MTDPAQTTTEPPAGGVPYTWVRAPSLGKIPSLCKKDPIGSERQKTLNVRVKDGSHPKRLGKGGSDKDELVEGDG